MMPLNAGKKELARKMRQEGYSVPEIARAVERSEQTTRGWVRDIPPGERTKRLGTDTIREERLRRSEPLRKRAKEMRDLGISCKEIAALVGVTDKTVSVWTAKPRFVVKVPEHLRLWNRKMTRCGVPPNERQKLIDDAMRSVRA